MRWMGLILVAGALCLTVRAGRAQSADTLRGSVTVTPFFGFAQNSSTGASWGTTPDRNHHFVGVHLSAPVLRAGAFRLSYAPNLVPLVIITHNPRYDTDITGPTGEPLYQGSGAIAGTGFSPAGLQLGVDLTRRLEMYVKGAVGGLWFTRMVPEPGTRRFNYTFEYGGGANWRLSPSRAVQVGYKFHHLSNLYTAEWNPGVDAHVFYAGMQWRLRVRRE